MGDFIDIMGVREKRGGYERSMWLISGFRQAHSYVELLDV